MAQPDSGKQFYLKTFAENIRTPENNAANVIQSVGTPGRYFSLQLKFSTAPLVVYDLSDTQQREARGADRVRPIKGKILDNDQAKDYADLILSTAILSGIMFQIRKDATAGSNNKALPEVQANMAFDTVLASPSATETAEAVTGFTKALDTYLTTPPTVRGAKLTFTDKDINDMALQAYTTITTVQPEIAGQSWGYDVTRQAVKDLFKPDLRKRGVGHRRGGPGDAGDRSPAPTSPTQPPDAQNNPLP